MNRNEIRRSEVKTGTLRERLVDQVSFSRWCCNRGFFTAAVAWGLLFSLPARLYAEPGECTVVVQESRLERSGAAVAEDKRWIAAALPEVRCSDASLKQRMEKALDVSGVDLSAELRGELVWLTKIEFRILYEDEKLVSGAFRVSGFGAYPSTYRRYVTVNKTSGEGLNAVDSVRVPEKLLGILHNMQEQDEKQVRQSDLDLSLGSSEMSRRFQKEDLNSFYVTQRGLVFVFDYEFPHAIEALEPPGEYLVSWNELRDNLIQNSDIKKLFLLYNARGI